MDQPFHNCYVNVHAILSSKRGLGLSSCEFIELVIGHVQHTYEILKLENMDDDRCYVQLYISMINCQVSDYRTCPLHL
jgi:hypothetical protein